MKRSIRNAPTESTLVVRTGPDLEPLIDTILSAAERVGYTLRERFCVRMAVEEAVINAIRHGHGGDTSKPVRVHYRVTPAELLAEVEDEGPGFRPADVPDPCAAEYVGRPHGRGLKLMRYYMTEVRYNDRGNRVTLRKCRNPA
jgi:serine/threonine-protein kinase RsbW